MGFGANDGGRMDSAPCLGGMAFSRRECVCGLQRQGSACHTSPHINAMMKPRGRQRGTFGAKVWEMDHGVPVDIISMG